MKENIQKVVHISHDDWDGEGALHLSALAYEGKYPLSLRALSLHQNEEGWTKVELHLHDFVLNHWTKETHLVVTDVSFREEIAELIQQKVEEGYSFVLIDHHKTAEWLGEQYEWATVVSEIDGVKTCATSLYLTHLDEQDTFCSNRQVTHYVNLVRLYDTWGWTVSGDEGNLSKRINDLLFIIGRKEFAEIILQELRDESKSHQKFQLPEKVTYLLDVEQYRIEQYIERKAKQLRKFPQTIADREYLVGGVFLENYHSEAGNTLCNLNTDIDFVVMVDAGKEKLSFRTIKEDVDVSAIAKTFKGGGHPKASGCSFNKETKELFVLPLLGQSTVKKDEEKPQTMQDEKGLIYEYQFYVEETGEGYDVKIYKSHEGENESLYHQKTMEDFNSLAEVFHYIQHYPLEPSCYIGCLFLDRLIQSTGTLTSQEKSFVEDLTTWNKIRKIDVLVTP